jgi:hypothetical protein
MDRIGERRHFNDAIAGKEIAKVLVVKGRLVNVVVR